MSSQSLSSSRPYGMGRSWSPQWQKLLDKRSATGFLASPSHHGINLYQDGSFLDFLYLSALKLLLCFEKHSYLPSLKFTSGWDLGWNSRSVDLPQEGAALSYQLNHTASPFLSNCRPGQVCFSFQPLGLFDQQIVFWEDYSSPRN